MSIQHHPTCRADYPEKPSGESAQAVSYSACNRDVVATCVDCGAFERYPRTTANDIGLGRVDEREFTAVYHRPTATGQIQMRLTCPFCHGDTTAYLWSLSGGGKRCPCGAYFGSRGTTYKLRDAVHS